MWNTTDSCSSLVGGGGPREGPTLCTLALQGLLHLSRRGHGEPGVDILAIREVIRQSAREELVDYVFCE